jgi:hypothetical protein
MEESFVQPAISELTGLQITFHSQNWHACVAGIVILPF